MRLRLARPEKTSYFEKRQEEGVHPAESEVRTGRGKKKPWGIRRRRKEYSIQGTAKKRGGQEPVASKWKARKTAKTHLPVDHRVLGTSTLKTPNHARGKVDPLKRGTVRSGLAVGEGQGSRRQCA